MPLLTQISHAVYILSAVLAAVSGYQYFQFRTPMARWASLFLASMALELTSYAILLILPPGAPYPLWNFLQLMGFFCMPLFWLLFVGEIAGSPKRAHLLTILSIATAAALLGRWLDISLLPAPQMPETLFQLPQRIGPLGRFMVAFYYSAASLALGILLRMLRQADPHARQLILPMLLGNGAMIGLSVLAQLGHESWGPLNLIHAGLAATSSLMFLMTVVWRFGGILPVNRDTIFEGIHDGVLILDYHNTVVDLNRAAQKMLGVSRKQAVKAPLAVILPVAAQLLADQPQQSHITAEEPLGIEGQTYTLEIQIARFAGIRKIPTGALIFLRNVTSREVMEQALAVRALELQRTNAFLASLAEVNVTLQPSTDPTQIGGTVGAELGKLGLGCFIARLDPADDTLHVSYVSAAPAILPRLERLLRTQVAGFPLDRDQFAPLYEVLTARDLQFQPFSQVVFPHGPQQLSAAVIDQITHLVGIEPEMMCLAVPLAVGERALGVIAVWGRNFQAVDISPFRIFANQVANVMERALIYEAETHRSAELARVNNLVIALAKVASIVGSTANSELVLAALGHQLNQAGLTCAIVSFDANYETAFIQYLSFAPEPLQRVEKLLGKSLKDYPIPQALWPGIRILSQREALWYPSTTAVFQRMFPNMAQNLLTQVFQILGFNAGDPLCIVPLVAGERVIGAMPIWGDQLKPSDGPILSVFGGQVAGIIQNMTNYENEVQRTNDLAHANGMIMALAKVAAKLDSTTDFTQIFDTLGSELRKVRVNCMVGTLDPAKEYLKIEYLSIIKEVLFWTERLEAYWPKEISIPRRLWPTDQAVTQKAPFWDPDPIGSTSKMFPFIPRHIFAKTFEMAGMNLEDQVCYLPMISEEEVIGIMAVWGPDLEASDIPGLSVFANQVATAIRNSRLYEQAQQEIRQRMEAEGQIRAALHEKEVLLKEVHHRVKNNLQVISSLLNLQAGQLSDPQTVSVLRESQNRVRSMALIHEKLYQSDDLAHIDFASYLYSLVASLAQTYRADPDKVLIQVHSDKICLNIDTAIPCGLIVNELVSNSLKYAFPAGASGTIEVTCTLGRDGRCTLVVCDDGVGLPGTLNFDRIQSLGLKLVTNLVRQIEGQLVIAHHGSARFEIEFSSL